MRVIPSSASSTRSLTAWLPTESFAEDEAAAVEEGAVLEEEVEGMMELLVTGTAASSPRVWTEESGFSLVEETVSV